MVRRRDGVPGAEPLGPQEGVRLAALAPTSPAAVLDVAPAGYHVLTVRRPVGRGRDAWQRAGAGLLAWRVQTGAGLGVRADGPVAPGRDAVVRIGLPGPLGRRGPLGLDAGVRVLAVVDEPRRRGFAYVTLAGHPVDGMEEFTVELADDDVVHGVVRASSRPGALVVRLAGPVGRVGQHLMARRYLRALERLARG